SLMALVDSDLPGAKKFGQRVSNQMIDKDVSLIRVVRGARLKGEKKDPAAFEFHPGSLIWRSDEYIEAKTDPMLVILDWLAHPFPRRWGVDVGNGARLDVLAYYPHTRTERFAPADPVDKQTFTAVKFRLKSPRGGTLPDQWVAMTAGFRETSAGAGLIEMLGQQCPVRLLDEFRNPPARAPLGPKGQLVLALGQEMFRVAVDANLGAAPQPLGRTGWSLRITSFIPNFTGHQANPSGSEGGPANPVVEFELSAAGKTPRTFMTAARRAGQVFPADTSPDLADLAVWYHPPDYR